MRRDRSESMIGRILKGLCPDDWGIPRLLTGVSHQIFGGLGFAQAHFVQHVLTFVAHGGAAVLRLLKTHYIISYIIIKIVIIIVISIVMIIDNNSYLL